MNRDITPPSGRAPSLEGPGRDEVYLLPPLTFHSFHHLGTLKTLTASMHLWIDVSHLILQLPYLLQLAMQLLLQLAILVYLCTEPIVPKAGQRVVDPVLTHIVVMEDSHSLGCGRCGLLWRETQRGMSRSSVNRGPWGGHAQGIGVVGHVDGDILCLDLAAIVYDLKGDIVQGYIEPELLQYARSLLRVRGASCCRRAWSSSSTLYALVSVWVSFLCGQEGGSEEGRSKVGASSRMKGEKQIQIL
jgi:hypothetical protein